MLLSRVAYKVQKYIKVASKVIGKFLLFNNVGTYAVIKKKSLQGVYKTSFKLILTHFTNYIHRYLECQILTLGNWLPWQWKVIHH